MENIVFLIGQILGLIAIVLGFISYQVKTQERVLAVQLLVTICFTLHYLCLGAWAGMAMNFIGIIRNIVFYLNTKKGTLNRALPIFFAVIMGVAGITSSLISKEGIYFLLSVAGLVINTYALSFSDPNNIRKSIFISSPLVLLYDGFARSYGGMIYESVAIVSAFMGMIRHKNKKA